MDGRGSGKRGGGSRERYRLYPTYPLLPSVVFHLPPDTFNGGAGKEVGAFYGKSNENSMKMWTEPRGLVLNRLDRHPYSPPSFSQSTLKAGKDRRYMQDEAERFGGSLLNRIAPVGVWFVSTVLHQISRKGAEAWPRYLQLLQSCIDHDPQWGNEHQCLHIQLLLQSRIL